MNAGSPKLEEPAAFDAFADIRRTKNAIHIKCSTQGVSNQTTFMSYDHQIVQFNHPSNTIDTPAIVNYPSHAS